MTRKCVILLICECHWGAQDHFSLTLSRRFSFLICPVPPWSGTDAGSVPAGRRPRSRGALLRDPITSRPGRHRCLPNSCWLRGSCEPTRSPRRGRSRGFPSGRPGHRPPGVRQTRYGNEECDPSNEIPLPAPRGCGRPAPRSRRLCQARAAQRDAPGSRFGLPRSAMSPHNEIAWFLNAQ